jgi:hypothetical protein
VSLAATILRRLLPTATAAAFIVSTGLGATARQARSPEQELGYLLGSWNCLTTRADRSYFYETDTVVPVGSGRLVWVHGMARPNPNGEEPASEYSRPFYDYYVGYVDGQWKYIQISPSTQTYFVGTSRDLRTWHIDFPAEQAGYQYRGLSRDQFRIVYPNLTQVCTRQSPAVVPQPEPKLVCYTHRADGATVGDQVLSIGIIATPKPTSGGTRGAQPATYPWWRGVAMRGSLEAPGAIIYEYNMFVVHDQRIAVIINGSNGKYAIASSPLAESLNDTSWTVVYPKVENGFTFTQVFPDPGIPTSFTINFQDGYQTCSLP